MNLIERQRKLIENLQLKLERCANPETFPDERGSQESAAHTLNLAIAGLKELLSIPMVRESGNLTIVGNEVEHVFDSETYKLLTSVVNTGLESPDQAPYQLKLIARILGIDGHQIQSE
jgi:hypothetical protein